VIGDPFWIMPTALQEACQFEKSAENSGFWWRHINIAGKIYQ
jgi:hypothetical protein